ncbi:Mur ligase family protein [Pasteurella atlantica]|uniref:Mur ligase family protein n=2 Tax=Pasteurellaceae TaxID=712 RepID=A0ACC6HN98_9PAST|nr:Mur ligase family protein [Pasteurella atlantica]MDP8052299.1 Mur ligase family protein [Pasteurella atlantica]MDP8101762.1 Mur ligase family protein [Pasteurella atlantica]MDP8105791.1 Mur ligase family protein [Pasteurella atlantica]MDP8149144.1 Mur ligase family protein [Pasteurella atlantica]
MKKITIRELFEIIGEDIPSDITFAGGGVNKININWLYAEKDNATFIERFDKNNDIDSCRQALSKGVALVFVRKEVKNKFIDNPRVVGLESPMKCLSRYLSYIRSLYKGKIVTITGSIGKTTTTMMMKKVLEDAYKIHFGSSIENSDADVVKIFQGVKPQDEIYLQEVGAAFPGYIEKSAIGLQPDVTVITNIGPAHYDTYQSIENILYDKTSLVRNLSPGGVAFLDMDNQYLAKYKTDKKVIYYSLHNEQADYYAQNIIIDNNSISFSICSKNTPQKINARINMLGEHNVRNALASYAVGKHFNIADEDIINSLAQYSPQGIRQNVVNVGGYHIFLDCFNSAKESFLGAVKTLPTIPLKLNGKRIVIMGEIDRLGDRSIEIHKEIGAELKDYEFDYMYCVGNNIIHTVQEAHKNGIKNIEFVPSTAQLLDIIRNNITRDDLVLYKATQLTVKLPHIIDAVYGTKFAYELEGYFVNYKKDKNIEYRYVGPILELWRYSKDVVHITTPSHFENKEIRYIGRYAFSECRQLETVKIADTVKNIGICAFYICPNLKYIKLPKSLKIIMQSAFNYCINLEEVEIPYGAIQIGIRAFYECKNLKKVIIPETVGLIKKEAFDKCPLLTVHCIENSYAYQYCLENNLQYQLMS